MAYGASNQKDERSRVLLKFDLGGHTKGSWNSLPGRGKLPTLEGDNHIRLLDIKPVEEEWGLSIDICFYKLSTAPEYTALSYVWGTDSNDLN